MRNDPEPSSRRQPPAWLSFDDVLILHREAMRRAGQPPRAVTDESRLRSKLARPENAYHYEGITDVFHLGALLAVSISQAQAFEDGNKRTAAMTLTAFLRTNGYRLKPRGVAVGQWLIDISEAAANEREGHTEEFADWLREQRYRVVDR